MVRCIECSVFCFTQQLLLTRELYIYPNPSTVTQNLLVILFITQYYLSIFSICPRKKDLHFESGKTYCFLNSLKIIKNTSKQQNSPETSKPIHKTQQSTKPNRKRRKEKSEPVIISNPAKKHTKSHHENPFIPIQQKNSPILG